MSITFFLTSLVVVLVPGTGVIYTVVAGLTAGRRASIAAAFGCTLGILPAITASIFGLAAVLHTSAVLFQVLKYAGAAYLLYLAYQTFREKGPMRLDAAKGVPVGPWRVVRTGFLINILNPKLSMFFMAFLPQFIHAQGHEALWQMAWLGGVFMVMTFVVFAVYGSFAAAIGERILASETVMAWMRRTVALAFAGFGLRLALSER